MLKSTTRFALRIDYSVPGIFIRFIGNETGFSYLNQSPIGGKNTGTKEDGIDICISSPCQPRLPAAEPVFISMRASTIHCGVSASSMLSRRSSSMSSCASMPVRPSGNECALHGSLRCNWPLMVRRASRMLLSREWPRRCREVR